MRKEKENKIMGGNLKIVIFILAISIFSLFLAHSSSAQASSDSQINASRAKELLVQAQNDISEMIKRNISILRVNESYQEALQVYYAQVALQEKGGQSNFKIVIDDATEIGTIKETAFKARDELDVFIENYQKAAKATNLSAMERDYNQILLSFREERFEDTVTLIDQGYQRLSELQSSQTTLRLFYSSTTSAIRQFLVNNWPELVIGLIVVSIVLAVSWNAIIRMRMNKELNHLMAKKRAINGLIKDMQYKYFKSKKLSEVEYKVKLKKFEEMLRENEREIMVLKEDMFKASRAAKHGAKMLEKE